MNRPLAQSAFFSVGVHLSVLLPLSFLPATSGEPAVDVVRGTSSVELELVAPRPEGGEGISRLPVPASSPAFLDEGVTVDWKAAGLKNDPPRYPWAARANGWQGTVVVRARVGPSGRAERLEVLQGSGHDILNEAALKAIQGWTFQPAWKNGKADSSWVEIPISFRLKTDAQK